MMSIISNCHFLIMVVAKLVLFQFHANIAQFQKTLKNLGSLSLLLRETKLLSSDSKTTRILIVNQRNLLQLLTQIEINLDLRPVAMSIVSLLMSNLKLLLLHLESEKEEMVHWVNSKILIMMEKKQ